MDRSARICSQILAAKCLQAGFARRQASISSEKCSGRNKQTGDKAGRFREVALRKAASVLARFLL
jgi:hypothetical protein